MKKELDNLKKDFIEAISDVGTTLKLDEVHKRFFSRKSGELTQIMKNLKNVTGDTLKEMGKLANQIKKELEEIYSTKKQELEGIGTEETFAKEAIDVTRPKLPRKETGHMHPISIVHGQLEDLFTSMGFIILDGPELESDYYNFEGLNIPETHPARESMDTFFIKNQPGWSMRPHTSPVQVRAMQTYGAPLRTVVPGRCFRNEATDGSHEHTFYQLEGLVVDKKISIAHLIGVMKGLLKGILKHEVEIRLRPGYFPFVEPGFELDMKCLVCEGEGCSACKHSGWVEMIPCGLVHPRVIEYGGLSPREFTGFAFGLGSMRLAMQKYGIEDIRYFHGGDLRFLEQF